MLTPNIPSTLVVAHIVCFVLYVTHIITFGMYQSCDLLGGFATINQARPQCPLQTHLHPHPNVPGQAVCPRSSSSSSPLIPSSIRTLRPPPNVDFVHGMYSSIPINLFSHNHSSRLSRHSPRWARTTTGRRQGRKSNLSSTTLPSLNSIQAIEVRCLQGVKAKWLRIELRKVETLPAGGMLSTFYDFVGPSPVNLWTSSDEYDLLKTVSLPRLRCCFPGD